MRSALLSLLLAATAYAGPKAHSTGDSFARDVQFLIGNGGEVTPKPKILKNGVPFGNLASIAGEGVVFKVVVPPQARNLVVRTHGGQGDCDLFVRRNAHPTRDVFDVSSRGSSTNERVKVPEPGEGPWYVLVDAYEEFRAVKLTASYEIAKTAVDLPQFSPGPGFFADKAVVQIKCPTKGVVIRYTVDDTEPTSSSPIYTKPLRLTTDIKLRAKAFRGGKIEPGP